MISASMLAAEANQGGAASYVLFLLPLLVLLWLFLTNRRRQREQGNRVSALAPGQRVITTAGLVGTLVSREGGLVRIEAAPGVVLTFDERALMGEAPSTTHPAGGDAGPTAPSKETD
ncbi:preprotein translocase subunit YajC [Arsenicicoccus sp. oral taxon 190]|uniref:preprotein translocase subunit YajC n=1 Tax=Arsenicicoccus sp. oral taxon 190 TaxID=1658671 RepID=UPI00067B593F|nr:preprotein translocase subunit YajC [Arsenicicoccus sp. oral taxon 190]